MDLRIPKLISKLQHSGNVYTDIQLQPGTPMSYRAPTGYRVLEGEDVISNDDIAQFAAFAESKWERMLDAGDGQFDVSVTIQGESRLRCNIFRHGHENTLGCQIRRLPLQVPSLDAIKAPFVLERLLKANSKGLVLITGPTGSGKSTTLAAMLEYLNSSKPVNIVTIEQPIEYEFKRDKARLIQREVPTNVTSFATGVVAAKRQDPDVIMIGEMRDRDTAEACLQAAYSGHLVLGTLHSRSAIETCDAMLDFFTGGDRDSKRHLLASSLLCVVSQTLLPSADGKSLVVAHEVLENNGMVSNAIRKNLLSNSTGGSNAIEGLQLLNATLARLVSEHAITVEIAREAAYDKADLDERVGTASKVRKSANG